MSVPQDSANLQKVEELLLGYLSARNDKEEVASVNKLVVFVAAHVQTRFLAVVEAAGKWMDAQTDEAAKVVRVLGEILGKVKGIDLTNPQKEVLTKYFLGLTKQLKLIEPATRAFDLLFTEHLLPTKQSANADPSAAKTGAEAGYKAFIEFLEKGSWLTSNYTQPIRYRIYNCLLHITKHWSSLCRGGEATFVSLVLNHTEEEMDPRNLFVVLEIWKHVLVEFPNHILHKFAMKIFDNISIYFPITFNNKNKSSVITVGDVSSLLNHCLSHELMVPSFIELIFSKMSEDNDSDRTGAVTGLVYLLNSEFQGKSLQHSSELQKIIDRSKTILPDLKEKDDMVKIFSLIGKILSKQQRSTDNRLFGYMLDRFVDDLVGQIKEKPASSDAHTNVSILKEVLDLTHGDQVTEVKISSVMWDAIFQLRKANGLVHLKLVLEQYVAIFLRSGIVHHIKNHSKTGDLQIKSTRTHYYSKSVAAGTFDFLLNFVFTSDSFDLRMLGVMAFKLALKSIRLADHPLELQLTKEKVLRDIQIRDSVESRCLVDFYFELCSHSGNIQQAQADFPQIATLVDKLSVGSDLSESHFETTGYVFMSYLIAKSHHGLELTASEFTVIRNLLLAANRELANPHLETKTQESLTYFLKMLAKLDTTRLDLHTDHDFCSQVLASQGQTPLSDLKESQQEARKLLEDFLAKTWIRTASATESVLAQVVNQLALEILADPSRADRVHQNLLLKLITGTTISLSPDLVLSMVTASLQATEESAAGMFVVQLLTSFLKRTTQLRPKYAASLELHSQKLQSPGTEASYLNSLRILKVLLARMESSAFKDVEAIIERHTKGSESQTKLDIAAFEILFRREEETVEGSQTTTSPLHLQRLFGIYTSKTKSVDRKWLVKSDLLLANQLPFSMIKPQLEKYIGVIENVVKEYPVGYDKQTLVDSE